MRSTVFVTRIQRVIEESMILPDTSIVVQRDNGEIVRMTVASINDYLLDLNARNRVRIVKCLEATKHDTVRLLRMYEKFAQVLLSKQL